MTSTHGIPTPAPRELLNQLPSLWVSAGILAAAFVVMSVLETVRPLRPRRESRFRRTGRNATTGALSLALVTFVQAPLVTPVVQWTEANGFGLLNLVRLPAGLKVVFGVLLLDYTLWHWHRINHVVPFFWRFHLVHHVDRDLDASTALRFHFGEHGLSIAWRVLQVLAIGASPPAIWVWHALLVVSILFHHSNTRLPIGLERSLVRFFVTPRMHGIHHSDWRNETTSNWASLFTAWDYLHDSILLSVPQREIVVGVPAYPRAEDVTLGRILTLPFRPRRPDWMTRDGPRLARPLPKRRRTTLATRSPRGISNAICARDPISRRAFS